MITYEYGQLTLKNSREKLTFRCSKEDADYIRSTALSIMSSPSTHVECADNCANSLEAAVAYNLKCGYKYLGVFDGWYLFMVKHNSFPDLLMCECLGKGSKHINLLVRGSRC